MRVLVILSLVAIFRMASVMVGEDFDHYVLFLSRSPSWCALNGGANSSPQCAQEADYGWILLGMWPQGPNG